MTCARTGCDSSGTDSTVQQVVNNLHTRFFCHTVRVTFSLHSLLRLMKRFFSIANTRCFTRTKNSRACILFFLSPLHFTWPHFFSSSSPVSISFSRRNFLFALFFPPLPPPLYLLTFLAPRVNVTKQTLHLSIILFSLPHCALHCISRDLTSR